MLEKRYKCFYRKQTGFKRINEPSKKTYYICHRSGIPQLLPDQQRKRKLKSQGSCKTASSCPSTIEVSETDMSIEAVLYTPHTHESTLAHVHLSDEEKTLIAGNSNIYISNLVYNIFHWVNICKSTLSYGDLENHVIQVFLNVYSEYKIYIYIYIYSYCTETRSVES